MASRGEDAEFSNFLDYVNRKKEEPSPVSAPPKNENDGRAVPSEATATSSDIEVVEMSVAERIASLKSQFGEAPQSPKEESNEEESKGSLEDRWKRVQAASSSYNKKPQDDNPQQEQESDEWHRVRYAADHLKPGAPKVGQSGNVDTMGEDTAAIASIAATGGGGDVWQSALNKFEQEGNEGEQLKQIQEQQDEEYARRMMGEMDRMGSPLEIEHEQSSPTASRQPTNTADSTEKLSLWQTFRVLYKRHPMIKYYMLGLLILLAATGAIIGVSVSNKNESSSSEDCVAASYTDEPAILFPPESQDIRAGGFGTSISASPEYLVVGAPGTSCSGSTCDATVGGGAYLYKRNNENKWVLYSTFLLADGNSQGDKFGESIAISEDSTTVVAGAPWDDGLGSVAGAIYVMEEPFASNTPPIRLYPSDIAFTDEFGGSVSVSATTLGEDSPVRVTNVVAGSPSDDDLGSNSGSVYVFSKFDNAPPEEACGSDWTNRTIDAGKWIQCQKLLPDDGTENDIFGKAVDISGRTIVVGAMWHDERGIDSGAAYVYSLYNDGNWGLDQKLLPVNFEPKSDRFAVSVATSGDRIVVGADLDNSQGEDSGAAYIFRLSNRVWDLESKLVPGTGEYSGYECGFTVDISNDGETVLVGCPGAPGGGVAYVYKLQQDSGKWAQIEKLVPTGSGENLSLGGSVALSGADGMAVVGYGKTDGEVFSYRKDC